MNYLKKINLMKLFNIFSLLNLLFILSKYLLKTRRYLNLFILIILYRPKKILEIGVYNGVRSFEMISVAKIFNNNIVYYGFDLFEEFYKKKNLLKNELSKKPLLKNQIYKKLSTLTKVKLYKGYTHKTLHSFVKNNKNLIDFIFIDGGHSIQTIKNDWKFVKKIMHKNTVVVFDDYYLNDKKIIKKFGCNFLKTELKKKYEMSLLPFTDKFAIKNGYRYIKMIKVKNV